MIDKIREFYWGLKCGFRPVFIFDTFDQAMSALWSLQDLANSFGVLDIEDVYFTCSNKAFADQDPETFHFGWYELKRSKIKSSWRWFKRRYKLCLESPKPIYVNMDYKEDVRYMSIEQMRDAVMKAYPGTKWKEKVKKWSDSRVLAVYGRLLDARKIK